MRCSSRERAVALALALARATAPLQTPRPPRVPPTFARADPWNLVLFGVIGGYLGSLLHPAEQQLLADVNEMRAERNMPPLKRDGGIFSLVKIDESLPPKP